jgi:hypothetical protein
MLIIRKIILYYIVISTWKTYHIRLHIQYSLPEYKHKIIYIYIYILTYDARRIKHKMNIRCSKHVEHKK